MSFFTASVTQCIPVKHTTYQLSVSTILIKKLGLPWSTYLNYRSKRNYERQIKQSLSCICSQGVELRATGAGLNCYSIPLKSSLWGVVLEKETRSIPLEVCHFGLCLLSGKLAVPACGLCPSPTATSPFLSLREENNHKHQTQLSTCRERSSSEAAEPALSGGERRRCWKQPHGIQSSM